MNGKSNKGNTPVVQLKPSTYQPNKAELEVDLRVKSTFENSIQSLLTPVEIKRVVL